MDLIIDNKIINTPILTILKQIKNEINNHKLQDIKDKHSYISVTCPHHKNGMEKKPSCSIYCGDSPNIELYTCNCFTCGFKGPLYHFIGECFDADDNFGKEWLIARFGNTLTNTQSLYLPKIEKKLDVLNYMDVNILNNFQSYHPYMTQRKLTQEVIDKFQIKYDPSCKCIIFPVYDEHNKLIMLTKRSVESKQFYIDKNIQKPVYLLNNALNNNYKTLFVCESQINALTLYTYNLPAIALFGTGSSHQYDILNKSGIKQFILCFDGDEAGEKGIKKFQNNIKGSFITILHLPPGKDVNDLTKEEFFKLLNDQGLKYDNFIIKNNV